MPSASRAAREGGGTAPPDPAALLRRVGLRATRERREIVRLLQGAGPAHLSAAEIAGRAAAAGRVLQASTIYNVLHALETAGLVRRLPLPGRGVVWDTEVTPQIHVVVGEGEALSHLPDGGALHGDLCARLGRRPEEVEVLVILRPGPTGTD